MKYLLVFVFFISITFSYANIIIPGPYARELQWVDGEWHLELKNMGVDPPSLEMCYLQCNAGFSYFNAINFPEVGIIEVTKNDLSSNDFQEIFLDNMINGLFDLKSLGSSFEGSNSLMYLINGSVKGIDGYIKRLIDEIRGTLKKNDLKASRIKIALSWSLDQHAMRGDKIEMLQNLTLKLRDYIGDVEAYEDPDFNLFHSDKTTIIVSCSKLDFDNLTKIKQDTNLIIVKATPLCETLQ